MSDQSLCSLQHLQVGENHNYFSHLIVWISSSSTVKASCWGWSEYHHDFSVFYESGVWYPEKWSLTIEFSRKLNVLAIACNALWSSRFHWPSIYKELTCSWYWRVFFFFDNIWYLNRLDGTSKILGDGRLLGREDFSTWNFGVVFLHAVFCMASDSSLEASLQYHLFFFRKHDLTQKLLTRNSPLLSFPPLLPTSL